MKRAMAGALLFALLLGAGAPLAPKDAHAAESRTLLLPQTDLRGERVEVPVLLKDGVYYLADEVRNIYTYNAHNGTGQFLTDDLIYRSETGVFDDRYAVSAYAQMIAIYDYYADGNNLGFSLRGVDGSHDEIGGNAGERSETRILVLAHYGVREQNAHGWFDKREHAAIVGVGDGREDKVLFELGRAADVIAHEYQHAITHCAVDLIYKNESGAIDEAISDIFGALAEGHPLTDDRFWEMGEDAAVSGKGIRSMKAPSDGYRTTVDDMVPPCDASCTHENCDSGGVHYNSTVLTHAQYKMWEALPAFFTRERIGTLWYRALSRLTADETFTGFTSALYLSARELGYGEDALRVMRECLASSGLATPHTVTFLGADGTPLGTQTVAFGGAATPPEAPARPSTSSEQFTFSGWDRDLACVTEDITVYAVYESAPRKYTVRYETGAEPYEREQAFGEALDLGKPPARKGMTFGGWYLDEALTQPALPVPVTGETLLYAKWLEIADGCNGAAAGALLLPLLAPLALFLRKKR